jgi:hypothetical protein
MAPLCFTDLKAHVIPNLETFSDTTVENYTY